MSLSEAPRGAPAPAHGSDRSFARPVVVLSKCLEVEACRYNAQIVRSHFVRRLDPWVDFVPVCPEVEIGLGVPRDPIRLVQIDGATRLVQPSTGRDLTDAMDAFAASFLDGLTDVDGFLLKNRSPSCGIKDVKVYAGLAKAPPVGKEPGQFGRRVLERFPGLIVEDEGRLHDPAIRAHFLTVLFLRAELRAIRERARMRDLVEFHTINKLLLMAYDQRGLRALGNIVANRERLPFDAVLGAYLDQFDATVARMPRRSAVVNVAQHAFGYFSKALNARERQYFLDLLERYRTRRAGLTSITSVLTAWIARFDEPYLSTQSFFEPYPRPLAVMDEV